jgi:hypothetical protein
VAGRLAMDQMCNVTDETFDRTSGNGAGRRRCESIRTRWHVIHRMCTSSPRLAIWPEDSPSTRAVGTASRRSGSRRPGGGPTAVDFSVIALEPARAMAQAVGADVAERIGWVESDLGSWEPPPGSLTCSVVCM